MSARRWGRAAGRLLLTAAAGAALTALLVRTAPGYGVDERDLDSRRSPAGHREPQTPWWVSREFRQPVFELVKTRAAPTILAIAAGLAVSWGVTLASALLAFRLRRRLVDAGFFTGALLLQCLPAGVIALLLLVLGARRWPAVALALSAALGPRIWQVTRGILARCSASPCIVMARSQGFGPWRIAFQRLLPLAWSELAALGAVSVSLAISLTIPMETLLDVPGLGQLAWQAALARDLPLLAQLMTMVTLAVVVASAVAEGDPA